MPAIHSARLISVALVLATAAMPAAAETTCAEQPMTARGDPSRFEVVAKATARSNWRAKVRAMPTLGAAYADFNKARDGQYRCESNDGQHLCTVVGNPCRD